MSDETRRLVAELTPYVRDLEADPGLFGELAHRRRRRHGTQAAVAVVAVLAVAVPVGAQRLLAGPAPAPVPPATSAPAPTKTAAAAAGPDLTHRLVVGPLSADYPAGQQSAVLFNGGELFQAFADDGAGGQQATVVRWDAGHPPAGIEIGRTPAPAVAGRPARWWCASVDIRGPLGFPPPADITAGPDCARLAWQDPAGQWLVADAGTTGSLDARRAATRQLAGLVRVGSGQPAAFPYSVSGVPVDWSQTVLWNGRVGEELNLGAPVSPQGQSTGFVKITAHLAGGHPLQGAVSGAVDGVPYQVSDTGTVIVLRILGHHGLDLQVESAKKPGSYYGTEQAVVDLVRHIVPVNDPANRANWTTDVIR